MCDVFLQAGHTIGLQCLEPVLKGLTVCQEHAEELYWPQIREANAMLEPC